ERIQQFILSFQAGFYSALTATAFFGILFFRFSQARIPSFLATLCLALTTYFWTYSRNLFDGVLCSTLLVLSFLFLLKYRQNSKWWDLVYCFVCLGFGFITRISMILAVVASFTYLASIYRASLQTRIREIALALITLLPFFGWQSWYNYLRTGVFYKSPVQTAAFASNNALDGNLFVGLQGLLFSPGKSLFVYAPLLILSILLFRKFYKQHRKEAIYVVTLTLLWLLLHSKLRSWYGAAGWGPRHFITILPILFLPFAVNLRFVLNKTFLKVPAILLGSFGFLLALSSILSNWHFRMMYAAKYGMSSDNIFVWSLGSSQSIDMLKGTLINIVRIITHGPIIKLMNSYSEANEYASSTINLWQNSFVHAGIPWYVVVVLVSPLLILMYLSARNILIPESSYSTVGISSPLRNRSRHWVK
ncbi:MAG: glycosyltransferase family 39 protein, partial [Chroococcidiopsidaceae cyanobacterium CP_BM_ER_R8_30]|nr:glycosyltransferase family 39 protein [Chroococcidiopsidaceae cyanobacterium CP_BM_ER_R8_30]